jgi:hypothetical protein
MKIGQGFADKRIIRIDGEIIPGLKTVSGESVVTGRVQIVLENRNIPISDGVRVMPEIEMGFLIVKGSDIDRYFKQWQRQKEQKTITQQFTDGAGVILASEIWEDCEIADITTPDYDAESVGASMVTVVVLPYDITEVEV